MIIYDKASWQLDGGISPKNVVDHFTFVFLWLEKNHLLSADGEEIENMGIDISVSLTDNLVTNEGKQFLDRYYDEYLKTITYGVSENEKWLDEHLAKMTPGGAVSPN